MSNNQEQPKQPEVANGPQSSDELLPLVYAELRELAARHLADERGGHNLSPTGLGHEA